MAYEFVIGRLQEYAREQREGEIKEARELQLKQLEAEHLEAVRLERQTNWIIEPDFKLNGEEVKKKPKNEFDKRLEVLKNWMEANGFEEGAILPKHYTMKMVYCELTRVNGDLFNSIEISSFERHFWRKQKICELTRGNKSTIL